MFIIVRRKKDSDNYEVYHSLKAANSADAVAEAAEYLSGDGAPATGEPSDIFEVAQIISKPLRALLPVLAATRTSAHRKERAKKVLVHVIQKGEF